MRTFSSACVIVIVNLLLILNYTRANQKYLNIYEKPYIIIFILHRGTRKGVDGMPLFFLVLLRQSEINENLLNSPEHPLQVIQFLLAMTSYNTKWRHSICHLDSAILDFTILLKWQEIMEIKTKSSQNAYKMD